MKIGNFEFEMDKSYQKVDSMPEDPPNSVPFCFQTDKKDNELILLQH